MDHWQRWRFRPILSGRRGKRVGGCKLLRRNDWLILWMGVYPKTSYAPGLRSVNLSEVIPDFIMKRLREGFVAFNRKMKGYLTNEVVVNASET